MEIKTTVTHNSTNLDSGFGPALRDAANRALNEPFQDTRSVSVARGNLSIGEAAPVTNSPIGQPVKEGIRYTSVTDVLDRQRVISFSQQGIRQIASPEVTSRVLAA